MPGGSYTLALDVTTCNNMGYPRFTYAFIDFNKNGAYDPEELISSLDVDNRITPVEVTFNVKVPCDAVPGQTRMRVFVVEGGHDVDPCLVFAYGGVKEFTINILEQVDRPCLPPARYCKTGNALVGDSNLGAVELIGVQGTAIRDASDCPNRVGPVDLTGLSASLQPGGTYVLSFEVTTCGLGWGRFAYAFIDYNVNSEFEESELLGSMVVSDSVAPTKLYFNFAVPCVGSGALVGTTRLRVYVVEGSGLTPNPCALFNYGLVKEFSVEILNKPINSCALGAVVPL